MGTPWTRGYNAGTEDAAPTPAVLFWERHMGLSREPRCDDFRVIAKQLSADARKSWPPHDGPHLADGDERMGA